MRDCSSVVLVMPNRGLLQAMAISRNLEPMQTAAKPWFMMLCLHACGSAWLILPALTGCLLVKHDVCACVSEENAATAAHPSHSKQFPKDSACNP